MRVFLGITGASGAPYAKRLVEALTAADRELGVCASSALGLDNALAKRWGDLVILPTPFASAWPWNRENHS